MKFTVSQSALMQALSVVAKGMASNSTLPVLSGIYIKAEEGVLEFQTTNLDISIRHRIAADVEEPDIVVAVIAEDGGTGSSTAVPIAKQIFDAYYYG